MGFPDTGPQDDGTRTKEQWLNAIKEDSNLIGYYLTRSLEPEEDQIESVTLALKEARRLLNDIRRFADEVHGLTKEVIGA